MEDGRQKLEYKSNYDLFNSNLVNKERNTVRTGLKSVTSKQPS